ncbi:MAG TPA: Smr/MutS family protein [Saprospiraceae bacterium]|nr:Smr/MutS family protein [Saprospiraceae bacterium]HRJ15576.1 Smr/MutS family protein [Saprospiraceae bacterium]HRK81554.1 Smr/MutS family protein [Saprospiraceae bacterium]
MLYAKGTRVRLRHSAEQGVVTEILDKDLLMIRLDGEDMEIPVFAEDLENNWSEKTAGVKAKVITSKSNSDTSTPAAFIPAESQYAILKSVGIQLAFDAESGGVFNMHLLNDTDREYIFHFQLITLHKKSPEIHGKLPAVSAVPVGNMLLDDLNDQPEIHIACSRITTGGLEPGMEKVLKIKAKQFFSKTLTAPILNRPVHLYKVFDRDESPAAATEQEDLKTYTRRKAAPPTRTGPRLRPHEVEELAHFVPEIDLHIEQLLPNAKKMSNGEIVKVQLAHFERFLDKALRVGAERVYIIHGVGKGKLRDIIATRLMQMDFVKTFNNDYHPRYGFGATEVILR